MDMQASSGNVPIQLSGVARQLLREAVRGTNILAKVDSFLSDSSLMSRAIFRPRSVQAEVRAMPYLCNAGTRDSLALNVVMLP